MEDVLIAAYLDESFDMAKAGVFIVGGLMGRGVAVFELERDGSGCGSVKTLISRFTKHQTVKQGKASSRSSSKIRKISRQKSAPGWMRSVMSSWLSFRKWDT